MRAAILDSSIYVSVLRAGEGAILTLREFAAGSTIWLSAVVLQELYTGARDRDRAFVEGIDAEFRRMDRILVPNLDDWTRAGRVLAQLAAKYHYEKIGRARLTNDALIAMTASRLELTLITANQRDFRRLSEFCSFHLHVLDFT